MERLHNVEVVNCAGHFDLILGIRGVAKPASDATAEWEGARAGGEQGATEQLVAFHMHMLLLHPIPPSILYALLPLLLLADPIHHPRPPASSAKSHGPLCPDINTTLVPSHSIEPLLNLTTNPINQCCPPITRLCYSALSISLSSSLPARMPAPIPA